MGSKSQAICQFRIFPVQDTKVYVPSMYAARRLLVIVRNHPQGLLLWNIVLINGKRIRDIAATSATLTIYLILLR